MKETEGARAMLDEAKTAANDFFNAFDLSRATKHGGNSTNAEQDLLRASLVFAAAGLDATIKQLVRDALPTVLLRTGSGGAQLSLVTFAARRLRDAEKAGTQFLAQLVASPDSRRRLIDEWIRQLTSDSLQSVEKVEEIASAFGMGAVFPQKDFRAKAKEAFEARNQIIHEMDLTSQKAYKKARQRRQRSREDMERHVNLILDTASKFVAATEVLLG